jgi:hypothetical protein
MASNCANSEQLLVLFHLLNIIMKTASVNKDWKVRVLQGLNLYVYRSRHFSIQSVSPEIRDSFLHCLFLAIRWSKTSCNSNRCIILWLLGTIFLHMSYRFRRYYLTIFRELTPIIWCITLLLILVIRLRVRHVVIAYCRKLEINVSW